MTTPAKFIVVPCSAADLNGIKCLYQSVSQVEGGIARSFDEISDDYIQHNLDNSIKRGVSFVAKSGDQILGEIHAYPPTPKIFAHVLSDLTIAVHPDFQGLGVGRAIFTALLREVQDNRPEILRVELIARESNQKAIRFYQSLGFQIEGAFRGRVRKPDGGFEADLPMAWLRT